MSILVSVRNIDEMGRITLPKEARERLGILPGVEVEVYSDGTSFIIRRSQELCVFCNSIGSKNFRGKSICNECLLRLKEVLRLESKNI